MRITATPNLFRVCKRPRPKQFRVNARDRRQGPEAPGGGRERSRGTARPRSFTNPEKVERRTFFGTEDLHGDNGGDSGGSDPDFGKFDPHYCRDDLPRTDCGFTEITICPGSLDLLVGTPVILPRPSRVKNKPKPAPTGQATPTPTHKQARLVYNTSSSANNSSANTSSAGNSSGDDGSNDDGSASSEGWVAAAWVTARARKFECSEEDAEICRHCKQPQEHHDFIGERKRKASGEARAARSRDNTFHARKAKLAHLIDHLPQALWDAFLDKAVRPRVKAISERGVIGSLLLGFLVRDFFTLHVADQLDAQGQPLSYTDTDIPVSAADIPNLNCRNLFLQLCRGLPGGGENTQPSAAVAAVLAAHPDLSARLEAIPRNLSDSNMVDHVGKQLDTTFGDLVHSPVM
ncbi:hypothetical protein QJQ45_007729 [Haematococcus lacustris]|nr:hypothetical protein QJQ45_007729 [Haematococcus lacustris]